MARLKIFSRVCKTCPLWMRCIFKSHPAISSWVERTNFQLRTECALVPQDQLAITRVYIKGGTICCWIPILHLFFIIIMVHHSASWDKWKKLTGLVYVTEISVGSWHRQSVDKNFSCFIVYLIQYGTLIGQWGNESISIKNHVNDNL